MMRAPACVVPALAAIFAAVLAGCAGAPEQAATGDEAASPPASMPISPISPIPQISQLLERPPDPYTEDGPDVEPPVDLDRVADATPTPEPLHATANGPYTALGREYTPMRVPGAYQQQGTASWYGRKYHGQRTSSGEAYDMYGMSASHPTLPIPSYARITNLANRASVVVRINNRGPFAPGRIIDVSYAAAHRLGFAQGGSAEVSVESILPPGQSVAAAEPPEATAEPLVAPPAAPAVPSAAAPKPERRIPVSNRRNGIYLLQLGAFSARANAEKHRARIAPRLESLGTEISIERRGALHRVQLGPYKDRAAADSTAKRVRKLLNVRPVLVIR